MPNSKSGLKRFKISRIKRRFKISYTIDYQWYSFYLLICTIKTDISDGDTPEIRDA